MPPTDFKAYQGSMPNLIYLWNGIKQRICSHNMCRWYIVEKKNKNHMAVTYFFSLRKQISYTNYITTQFISDFDPKFRHSAQQPEGSHSSLKFAPAFICSFAGTAWLSFIVAPCCPSVSETSTGDKR